MSDAEAVMWAVESDPFLRTDFMNVTMLDGLPDPWRLQSAIEDAIAAYPPLRQRVERPPLGIAPPLWADDPDFDLGYHVRRVAVPPPGTPRQLLDLAAALAAPPLDRVRPLWEVTVVEGIEGGGAAVLQRLHHALTDGMGGMQLLRFLFAPRPACDGAPPTGDPNVWRHPEIFFPTVPAGDPAGPLRPLQGWWEEPDPEWPRLGVPLAGMADAFGYRLGQGLSAARRGLELAGMLRTLTGDELRAAANQAGRTARSVADQLVVSGGPLSPLMGGRSLGRRFETLRFDLQAVRRAGRAVGVNRNAVFVAGVTRAMGLYHERLGVPGTSLRMAVPVSLRGSGPGPIGGNRFAPARAVVDVGQKDPARRLTAAQRTLDDLAAEPGFSVADQLAGLVSLLPPALLVPALRSQTRTVDFTASIVPGLRSQRFLAGARVEASYPMGPRLGCAVNFTLLCCGESLDLGVNLDPAAVTDPAVLMDCVAESFSDLTAAAD